MSDIPARPLQNSLRDYQRAMSAGPLHDTWTDKPHRLVYDLISAVKYHQEEQRQLERELAEAKRDAERWAELIEAAKEVDRIGVGGHLRLCKALDAMRGE